MRKPVITNKNRDSYLDDVQILRNRGLSAPQIAQELSKGGIKIDPRQIERWKVMLVKQRRWRRVIVKDQPVQGAAAIQRQRGDRRFYG